jgi:hypothetical protein
MTRLLKDTLAAEGVFFTHDFFIDFSGYLVLIFDIKWIAKVCSSVGVGL